LSDPIVLKGGAATADVMAYTASNDNSGEVTISGFETIQVTNGDSESTLNLKNVTGANNIVAIGAGQLIISNFGNTQKIALGTYVGSTATAFSDGTGDTLTVSRAANGTADILNLDLNTTAVFTVTDNQAETVNLTLVNTAGNDDHSVTLSSTSATTVNVVGAGADEDLTLTASGALLTTVNASALVGNFTYDVSNRAAQALTITAGTGNDTIGMTIAADVLDGGTKASDNDTLNISLTGTGGALIVDLSSATDQVTMFNGLANAAVQKNFESVSAAAYTQTNSIGADITGTTGANTVTGSAYADTIRTGAGADTIIVATATAGNSDFIDGGADSDTLQLAVGSHTFGTNDNLVNVESITLGNGTNTLTLTGQTEAFTITGGTGADTIVGGSGIDTITTGIGADVITGAAGADVITLSVETTAAIDTVIYNASSEGGDSITGFITTSDKINLKESAFGTTATFTNNALVTTNAATATYFEVTTDAAATAVDLNAAGTTTTGIVVFGASTGTGGVKVYYTADVGAFAVANSTLIATLTGIALNGIAAGDFVGF
jgi:Ca2+-binding RTX toxin-like protein